ncbi:TPA: hypothetical protein N6M59_004107, partial [Escherichia coli]|nr:hypothetical protein [Escherichia coli]
IFLPASGILPPDSSGFVISPFLQNTVYTYNINIPVRHNDPESIDNIRGALHYLAKEEQKDGLCAYGCNEVPERPAAGRPRNPHF